MAQQDDGSDVASRFKSEQTHDQATKEKDQTSGVALGENTNDTEGPTQREPPALSKSQQKKLKRKQEWEASRESRKAMRKEKNKAKKERDRAAGTVKPRKKLVKSKQVPISFVIDCQFDELMADNERTSLASQITRCYSDNRNSPFKAHLAVSSFAGKLKERFDTVLHETHKTWEGVRFRDSDFVAVAEESSQWMLGPKGGSLVHALEPPQVPNSNESGETFESNREVIYLTSESSNTLTELKPYSTYIIGGLVDRNRHKGICYKRAMDRGIKTAKLPIGNYLKMQSRFVLATNHVCEIMLKWLELGDWTRALVDVVPKRKGGQVKIGNSSQNSTEAAEDLQQDDKEENTDVEDVSAHEACAKDSSLTEDVKENTSDIEAPSAQETHAKDWPNDVEEKSVD